MDTKPVEGRLGEAYEHSLEVSRAFVIALEQDNRQH